MRFSGSSIPILLYVVLIASAASAQDQPAAADPCTAPAGPAFEVASVHERNDMSGRSSRNLQPDGITATGATVLSLVSLAFDLRDFQVANLPGWAQTVGYDVTAKVDPPEAADATLTEAERAAMQQRMRQRIWSLLTGRFELKCHTEMREQPVYELVVAKGGPKMASTKVNPDKQGSLTVGGKGVQVHVVGTGLTSASITRLTSNEVKRLVIDKTGLKGAYDFQVDWVHQGTAAAEGPESAPAGPTVFTALEEQLGLKLVPAKAQEPIIVIDHIERPSEN